MTLQLKTRSRKMSKPTGKSSAIEVEIIELMSKGDSRGITLMYDNYGPALFGIISRIVKSQELAEEVLQDVFLKIWNHFASYDDKKGRLFTWLSNIARNKSIDVLRSAQYKKADKTDSIENFQAFNERLTTSSILQDSGLRKVIDSLDNKYKKLIYLAYFEGYSQREIEKEFGIPLGTVKTRMRAAINTLRAKLNNDIIKQLLFILPPLINATY